ADAFALGRSLVEDGGRGAALADRRLRGAELVGARLRLRREALDPDLVQPVLIRQVTEGLVCGDEGGEPARSESVAVRRVQYLQRVQRGRGPPLVAALAGAIGGG